MTEGDGFSHVRLDVISVGGDTHHRDTGGVCVGYYCIYWERALGSIGGSYGLERALLGKGPLVVGGGGGCWLV